MAPSIGRCRGFSLLVVQYYTTDSLSLCPGQISKKDSSWSNQLPLLFYRYSWRDIKWVSWFPVGQQWAQGSIVSVESMHHFPLYGVCERGQQACSSMLLLGVRIPAPIIFQQRSTTRHTVSSRMLFLTLSFKSKSGFFPLFWNYNIITSFLPSFPSLQTFLLYPSLISFKSVFPFLILVVKCIYVHTHTFLSIICSACIMSLAHMFLGLTIWYWLNS